MMAGYKCGILRGDDQNDRHEWGLISRLEKN